MCSFVLLGTPNSPRNETSPSLGASAAIGRAGRGGRRPGPPWRSWRPTRKRRGKSSRRRAVSFGLFLCLLIPKPAKHPWNWQCLKHSKVPLSILSFNCSFRMLGCPWPFAWKKLRQLHLKLANHNLDTPFTTIFFTICSPPLDLTAPHVP